MGMKQKHVLSLEQTLPYELILANDGFLKFLRGFITANEECILCNRK